MPHVRMDTRMSHVTYEWVMSHMNESCHIRMSHLYNLIYWRMNEWCPMSEWTHEWVMSRMNESCHIWTSHVTYEWAMSPIQMSHVSYVISHMNESCHIWTFEWVSDASRSNKWVKTTCSNEKIILHLRMNGSCHKFECSYISWTNPLILSQLMHEWISHPKRHVTITRCFQDATLRIAWTPTSHVTRSNHDGSHLEINEDIHPWCHNSRTNGWRADKCVMSHVTSLKLSASKTRRFALPWSKGTYVVRLLIHMRVCRYSNFTRLLTHMSHVKRVCRYMSALPALMSESSNHIPSSKWVMSHIWMSHVTHM